MRRRHNSFKRYRDINNPKYIEAARLAKLETSEEEFFKKLAENIKKDNKEDLNNLPKYMPQTSSSSPKRADLEDIHITEEAVTT